jgi:hypothetical protein
VSLRFSCAFGSANKIQNEETPAVNNTSYPPALGLRQMMPPELLLQIGISLADLNGGSIFTSSFDDLELLANLLPPEVVASRFVDNAYRYGFPLQAKYLLSCILDTEVSSSFYPLPLAEYRSGIYKPLYQDSIQLDHPLLGVRLAVMYALLAYGAQKGIPHSRNDVEFYMHLCRAAMVHARLVESPTIEGIQALFIFSLCLSFMETASSDNSNMRWAISGYGYR